MSLFSKLKTFDSTSASAPKTRAPKDRTIVRSALRFAFNPEIGSRLRPMRESTEVFVYLLAAIFISMGMFPADHPAYLRINGTKLGFSTLMSTVWRELKFTRANLPKIFMFFALLVGLFFAGLALLTLILSIFSAVFAAKAHAAGYFTSPAGDDIAEQWITFLRSGDSSGDFFSQFAEPLMWAAPIQTALVTALGYYSHAILIIAAVILFYHLSAMVVETAHHGQVMGKKADQVWAPIRLVVAIGLLVPIGTGLNTGQYIVFKLTEWGSGLASGVWDQFLSSMPIGLGVGFAPPYAADVVYNTFLTEVCRNTYDAYDNGSGTDTVSNNDPKASRPTADNTSTTGGISASSVGHKTVVVNNINFCGHHNFNQSGTGNVVATFVASQAQSCFDQMQQDVSQYSQTVLKYFTPPGVGGSNNTDPQPYDGSLFQKIGDYMVCLGSGIPLPDINMLISQGMGWLSAGAYVSSIAQAEADANDLGALIPDTQPPDANAGGDPTMKHNVMPVVGQSAKYVNMVSTSNTGSSGEAIGTGACGAQRATLQTVAQGMQNQGPAQGHFLDRVFQAIDWIAAWNCVWIETPVDSLSTSGFSVGIMMIGANPLAEMAALGQACINTAYDTFDMMVNLLAKSNGDSARKKADLSPAGSNAALEAFGLDADMSAVSFISSILGMITVVFFTSGVLLAYYVPLIPFILFLFGILSWVLAVLEAIVAVPLLALAHLTVQGEGLPGSMAQAGYFFLFNIALRPVLMVFGLIVGLLVFNAAVSYMNEFYLMAISTSGGLASGHLFLSRLVYNGLYVIIIYICANSSFKAIHALPDHAMKWLNKSPYHFERMGELGQVTGPLMSGANNISQVTGALQSGNFAAAKALQHGVLGDTVMKQQGLIGGGGGGATPPVDGAPQHKQPEHPHSAKPPAAPPPKP